MSTLYCPRCHRWHRYQRRPGRSVLDALPDWLLLVGVFLPLGAFWGGLALLLRGLGWVAW